MGDGGCQPANQCGLCCESQCKLARKFDKHCVWTGAQCVRCYPDGVYDNGGPIVGSPVVLPNWITDGAGDLIQLFPACLKRYVTGMVVYMTQTDTAAPTPSSISSRVIIFQHATGIVQADWTGTCTSTPIAWLAHSYQITCEFHAGVMRILGTPSCEYPQLPPDWYDVMFAQTSSPTLGWITTQPPTGCTFANECSFTQQMAPVPLERTDLCTQPGGSGAYRNLAFQLLGSNSIQGLSLPSCR